MFLQPRIVHVIDPLEAGDPATLACAQATRCEGFDHEVWLLCSTDGVNRAHALGLESTDRISAPLGQTIMAARALRRLNFDRLKHSGEPVDVFHAWNPNAATAVNAAFGSGRAIQTVSNATEPGPDSVQRLIIGETLARQFARRTGRAAACTPLPALLSADQLPSCAMARRMIGATDTTPVVVLLGRPEQRLDAIWFTLVMGLAHAAGGEAVGLYPPSLPRTRNALRLSRDQAHRWHLLPCEWTLPWQLAGADLAVVDRVTGHDSLLLSVATGVGVPVVGGDHPLVREALHGLDDDLMKILAPPTFNQTRLAHSMTILVEKPELRRRASAALLARTPGANDDFKTALANTWNLFVKAAVPQQ